MKIPVKLSGLSSHWLERFSLRTQLLQIIGILMILQAFSTAFIVNSEISSSSRHQADSIGQLLSEQTASAAVDMLVTGDRLSLNILLSQLVQNPYVAEANIYSIDNRRIARATSQGDRDQKSQVYSAPIHYQDVIAGYVRLYLNEELLSQKPREALVVIIAIGILLMMFGFIILYQFGSSLSGTLKLIERQLFTISPTNKILSASQNEITRISAIVEHQLTEKWSGNDQDEATSDTETSAILTIRTKNLGRLQSMLAVKDMEHILKTHSKLIERAASFYAGEVTYTPEGNAYIRFSSEDNDEFSIDALCCGLMIEELSALAGEQHIAKVHLGVGLSFSDDLAEFPEEQYPALFDSAASQALQLANISEPDGLHMFRNQLQWLPTDLPELQVSEVDPGIVLVKGLTGELEETLKNQVFDVQNDLNFDED